MRTKRSIVGLIFLLFWFGILDVAQAGDGKAHSGTIISVFQDAGSLGGFLAAGSTGVAAIVGIIVQMILAIVGLVFLVTVVFSGFMWMSAAGDEKKAGEAQRRLSHSLIGLAIVVVAYIITVFVVNALVEATGGG